MNSTRTWGSMCAGWLWAGFMLAGHLASAADGVVVTDFNLSEDQAGSGIITPDGKLISVGYTAGPWGAAMGITRHGANGRLDTTFGVSGKCVITPAKFAEEGASAVGLQQDGKIIVGGSRWVSHSSGYWVIARLNTNGALDTSFASKGIFATSVVPGAPAQNIAAILIQPDNKIVAVGFYHPEFYKGALLRLNANGTLDKSFGKNGIVLPPFTPRSWSLHGVALQGDKIVVCGYANFAAGQGGDLILMRFNTNGSLDTTLGGTGIVVANFQYVDYGENVAIDAAGGVLVSTEFRNDEGIPNLPYYKWSGVVRFLANGTLDTDFGVASVAECPRTDGYSPTAMALQPDGGIVLTGSGYYETVLTRYTFEGVLDTSFGTGGWVIDPVGTAGDVKIDGAKIVVIGFDWSNEVLRNDFFAARYLSDGTPDWDFGD